MELTDTHGQRSSAAVEGLLGPTPRRDRGVLPTPGGPADAPGTAAVFSGPIVTGLFRVAGLTWDADADLAPGSEIHLRVREDGAWSDWLETPDEQSAENRGRHGTAPFVTGGADAVQVHFSGNPADLPTGLELDVIQGGAGPSPTNSASPSSVTPAVFVQPAVARQSVGSLVAATAVAQPTIVSRAGWKADESLRNGWEATTAELRAAVVGAHAQGYNTYSMAISAMGDYSLKTPTTVGATFTAPTVSSGKTSISLTFTFTVTDARGATGSDSVVVKVVRK